MRLVYVTQGDTSGYMKSVEARCLVPLKYEIDTVVEKRNA